MTSEAPGTVEALGPAEVPEQVADHAGVGESAESDQPDVSEGQIPDDGPSDSDVDVPEEDLPAVDELRPQVLLLILVQLTALVLHHIVVGREQESTGATGWIADRVLNGGLNAVHNRLDEFSRREILPSTLWALLGTLAEQAFIDVALHVGVHA